MPPAAWLRREPTPEAGANFTGDELDNGQRSRNCPASSSCWLAGRTACKGLRVRATCTQAWPLSVTRSWTTRSRPTPHVAPRCQWTKLRGAAGAHVEDRTRSTESTRSYRTRSLRRWKSLSAPPAAGAVRRSRDGIDAARGGRRGRGAAERHGDRTRGGLGGRSCGRRTSSPSVGMQWVVHDGRTYRRARPARPRRRSAC